MRKRSWASFAVWLALLVWSAGLSAQTWQRVMNFPQHPVAAFNDPFEIVPTAGGGWLAITSRGLMAHYDSDGDTLWTRVLPDSLDWLRDVRTGPDGAVYLLSTLTEKNRIMKLDNSGAIIDSLDFDREYEDFCVVNDGFLLAGSSTDSVLRMLRINFLGDTLWYQEYTSPQLLRDNYDVIPTMDGGFITAITELALGVPKHLRLVRTDDNGNILWTTDAPDIGDNPPTQGRILEEPDGSFVLISQPAGSAGAYFIRLSSGGQVLLEKTNFTFIGPHDFAPTPDGGFWGVASHLSNGLSRLYIFKFDHNFDVVWKRYYPLSVYGSYGEKIAYAGGNNYAILGGISTGPGSFDPTLSIVMHPDSLGNMELNLISGNLKFDLNENCEAETGEPGLANWLVSTGIYFTLTDTAGHFELSAGAGATNIQVYPPMVYWEVCPGFDTLTFTQTGDTAYLDIPVFAATQCPYTEINLATANFRPCFESLMSVQYCNIGTVDADSASALIVLPPGMDFVSATLPVALQSGDSVWFDLNTLEVGACGSFQLTVLVDCDTTLLGQTLCVEARIFPDTICFPGANWSGAEVSVSAQCINNQEVELTIRNIGTAPTTPVLDYIIIEDQVVLLQGQFQLQPDSVLRFTEPANGSFWRISAEQEVNFPVPSMPAAWVEGCGGQSGSGYVNNYFFNDAASSVDLDCRVVTGSYDPNDKQAFPEGYGAEHYIEPGTELTYLIRFQNTGTDTAFTVILRDTLDPWLDPASLRPGAGSHPYEFEITGAGVMKVWFKQIMLPDSNVNEAASHGFFQYKVQMKPGIPLETQIFNRAAIYFDFNAPVITNQTYHTVGKNFYIVSITDLTGPAAARLKAAPNPFRETTRLTIEGAAPDAGEYTFRLFDMMGRQLRLEQFDGPEMLFRRNGLPAGLYFFQLEQHGRPIASGKMTAQ